MVLRVTNIMVGEILLHKSHGSPEGLWSALLAYHSTTMHSSRVVVKIRKTAAMLISTRMPTRTCCATGGRELCTIPRMLQPKRTRPMLTAFDLARPDSEQPSLVALI